MKKFSHEHLVISLLYFVTINTLLVETTKSNKIQTVREPQLKLGNGQQVCSRSMCTSTDCATKGSIIGSNIDESIDPCNDFYSYVCGNFQRRSVIPENTVFKNMFTTLKEDLLNELRIILEENPKNHNSAWERLPMQFYGACMNASAIEEKGVKTLVEQLMYLGGWPVLFGGDWHEEPFSWVNTILLLKNAGLHYDTLFNVYVGPDMTIATHKVIYLDQPTFGLERVHLIKGLNDKHVMSYLEYMFDIAIILGADHARAAEETIDTLKFEIELARISPAGAHRRHVNDDIYNPMMISAIESNYPSIPWIFLLNGIFHPHHVVVPEYEYINVQAPTFFTNLGKLLEATPKRVVANYMIWRVIQSLIPFLPESLRGRERLYGFKLTGRKDYNPKWIECVETVRNGFPHAMGSMYVRKYFNPEAKVKAINLFEKIRKEFVNIIGHAEWMDRQTRNIAIDKIKSMSTENIGYPQQILDVEKLEQYYSSFVNGENKGYLDLVLALNLFTDDKEKESLRKIINKNELRDMGEVADTHAYYSLVDNNLHVPAGLLQGLFFSTENMNFLNYGATGFIMAHEMVHAIDAWGRHVNKDGVKGDWWGDQTTANYKTRSECFVNQYSNYEVNQIGDHIDGARTLEENIADNVAIKVISSAYKTFQRESKVSEVSLPGLNKYDASNSFWISAASIWCSHSRPEYLRMAVTTDYRSIQKYRVNGPASNSPYFAEVFSCPSGSEMNPTNKCELW